MNLEEENLSKVLQKELDTRDKRFMFLKLEFPRLVSRIDLEGSSYQASWNIIYEFKRQQELGKLIKVATKKLK